MRFPLSGHARDLHPLDYAHVGRTEKSQPVEYQPVDFVDCDPYRIQTYNLLIRSQTLYSIELMGQNV